MSRNKHRPPAKAAAPAPERVNAAPPSVPSTPLAAPPTPPDNLDAESAVTFLWKVHDQADNLIRFADTKASIILAIASGILSTLFGAKIYQHFTRAGAWTQSPVLAAASLVSLALLAAGIGLAVSAIAPRLGKRGQPSLIYWQGILAHGAPAAYAAQVVHLTETGLVQHLTDHLFVLARICRRKYTQVQASIWLAALGGAIGGVVALFPIPT